MSRLYLPILFFKDYIYFLCPRGEGREREGEERQRERELTVWLPNMNFVNDSVGGGPITISKRLDMSRTEMFLPVLLGPLRCHWSLSGHLALARGS